MIDCKCSFTITLIKQDFNCEKSQTVTRRGGPDIACTSELGSQRCKQLYEELKAIGLPAFDAEDDLLKTPASVYSKIQFGGLLGLANLVAVSAIGETKIKTVDNIYQLLEQAVICYKTLGNIPYPKLVDDMTAFKIQRNKRVRSH